MKRQRLDTHKAPAANSFNNENAVSNQIGTQNVHGDVSYYITQNDRDDESQDAKIKKRKEVEALQERRIRFHRSLRFDELEARHTTIRPAHHKTCRWLLTRPEYIVWNRDDKLSEHHGLMWIKGKPGTGKSTIMKFVFAEAQKQDDDTIVIAFFFNARGGQLEKSVIGMYRSLLFQLLDKRPELLAAFDGFRRGQVNITSTDWNTAMLVEIFGKVIGQLGDQRVICFIDALDECANEQQVRDMLSDLKHLGQIASGVRASFRICLSSRHYPHITVSHGLSLVLERQPEHEHDIIEYLQTALEIGSGKTALGIKKELLQRASGVFLWVVLVTRILNTEYDKGQMSALRKRLNEIPDDLGKLFRDILMQDGVPQPQLISCIQWVLYAHTPLTPDELYFAIHLGTEPESVSDWIQDEVDKHDCYRLILNSSKGLVEQTSSSLPTIQFIHETVRDYLLTGHGMHSSCPSLFPLSTVDSHEQLKRYCESYHSKAYDVICQSLAHSNKVVPELTGSKIRAMFPLIEHAIRGLFYHCDMAQKYGCDQQIFLRNFDLASWVVLYNSLQAFDRDYLPVDVSMLYVVAAYGLPNLTKMICQRDQVTNTELVCGQHASPLMAALAVGSLPTLEVLLSSDDHDVAEEEGGSISVETGSLLCRPDDVCRAAAELLDKRVEWIGRHLFTQAVCNGYQSLVRCMIKSDRHGELYEMGAAICAASEYGHAEVVKALLDARADVNAQGGIRGSPLRNASFRGHTEIVQILVDAGADLNAQGDQYGTALCAASFNNHIDIVKVLLSAGADINKQGGEYGNSLCVASLYGYTKTLQTLLDAGADINAPGGRFSNSLCAASFRGHMKTAQILIDTGADVNAQGGRYGNSLCAASLRGDTKMVQMLINAGADVNAQGGRYGNSLCAASFNGYTETARILIDAGADVNARGGEYGGSLYIASFRRYTHMVQMLLDAGANVNTQGGEYGNSLCVASLYGYAQIVRMLIDAGADVNAQGGKYGTALCNAALRGDDYIVRTLLCAGAQVNALAQVGPVGEPYPTALHAAVRLGHEDIALLLINAGADVNIQKPGYATVLEIASKNGCERVAQFLVDAGAI